MSRNHHVYPEIKNPIDLVVHTKSPEKWILLDRETGETYVGSADGYWQKLVSKNKHPDDLKFGAI
jgi:hypothetical protein